MEWLHDFAYCLAGALFANAAPHWISGVCGRAFQTPFATPPGKGLSSATVNVVWGSANAAIGAVLLIGVGAFDPHRPQHAASLAIGLLAMGVLTARIFGKLHGGDLRRPL